MRVLYFASLREAIGQGEEELTPPPSATTPRDLIAHLAARGAPYSAAFSDLACLRCALDQEFCTLDTPLGAAREIAFFPPVTGG